LCLNISLKLWVAPAVAATPEWIAWAPPLSCKVRYLLQSSVVGWDPQRPLSLVIRKSATPGCMCVTSSWDTTYLSLHATAQTGFVSFYAFFSAFKAHKTQYMLLTQYHLKAFCAKVW